MADAGGIARTPTGNVTGYQLDAPGRATVTVDPNGARVTVGYDANGRQTAVTDEDGRTTDYAYDNDGRLTAETWLSSAGVTVNLVTYSYDNDGDLLAARDFNGTVTQAFDALNRVTNVQEVYGQSVGYGYDKADRVTLRTDSLGGTLTIGYDAGGRDTGEAFTGTDLAGAAVNVGFGYDARNEQTAVTWYSNAAGTATVAQSLYAYDSASRVTAVTNKSAASATLSYYDYTYGSSNLVATEKHSSTVGTVTYNGQYTYSYDNNNQLLSDGTTSFAFDANGNRTSVATGGGASVTYATGVNNRVTFDGTFTYTYDAVGNQVEKQSSSQTWQYGYDQWNRLTSVTEVAGGATVLQESYTYDVLNERVAQSITIGGTTTVTRFVFDRGQVVADLSAGNAVQARYLYGYQVDQVLARTVVGGTDSGVSAYFTDDQGSVRDIDSFTAGMVDHLDYGGFGVQTQSNAAAGDRNGYTGGQYDAGTGLVQLGRRYYDPQQGRWVTEDPIGFAAGQGNLYQYVGNDATNATDPTGLGSSFAHPDNAVLAADVFKDLGMVAPPVIGGGLLVGAAAVGSKVNGGAIFHAIATRVWVPAQAPPIPVPVSPPLRPLPPLTPARVEECITRVANVGAAIAAGAALISALPGPFGDLIRNAIYPISMAAGAPGITSGLHGILTNLAEKLNQKNIETACVDFTEQAEGILAIVAWLQGTTLSVLTVEPTRRATEETKTLRSIGPGGILATMNRTIPDPEEPGTLLHVPQKLISTTGIHAALVSTNPFTHQKIVFDNNWPLGIPYAQWESSIVNGSNVPLSACTKGPDATHTISERR